MVSRVLKGILNNSLVGKSNQTKNHTTNKNVIKILMSIYIFTQIFRAIYLVFPGNCSLYVKISRRKVLF